MHFVLKGSSNDILNIPVIISSFLLTASLSKTFMFKLQRLVNGLLLPSNHKTLIVLSDASFLKGVKVIATFLSKPQQHHFLPAFLIFSSTSLTSDDTTLPSTTSCTTVLIFLVFFMSELRFKYKMLIQTQGSYYFRILSFKLLFCMYFLLLERS